MDNCHKHNINYNNDRFVNLKKNRENNTERKCSRVAYIARTNGSRRTKKKIIGIPGN